MSIDTFYPISETIQQAPNGLWTIGMFTKLETHLKNAMEGDRDAESKLVNRLGQLRRHYPTFAAIPANLQGSIKRSAEWLRTTGRKIDFKNENPALWITQRDGSR